MTRFLPSDELLATLTPSARLTSDFVDCFYGAQGDATTWVRKRIFNTPENAATVWRISSPSRSGRCLGRRGMRYRKLVLVSMIRAWGNGAIPASHAAWRVATAFPPEPASSTKTTYGRPLILMGIVCCAVAPSFHNTLPICRASGFV